MRLRSFVLMAAAGCIVSVSTQALEVAVLENSQLGLTFDRTSGALIALENKLTGETYAINNDYFVVDAAEFLLDFREIPPASVDLGEYVLRARYETPYVTAEVAYQLHANSHYAEKAIVLTSARDYRLKHMVVSQPAFSGNGISIVEYRYPTFERPPGTEPSCTFFGRTDKGGFFTGMEEPFDDSSLDGNQVTLGYAPSLKIKAAEKLISEPVYFGVYKKSPHDMVEDQLPLWSESEAMVAMTSSILGGPRHGFVPMACGWHSEMAHNAFTTEAEAIADMKSLDFLAECGIDWCSDSHPWGGETEKLNALTAGEGYEIGPLNRQFLAHAREAGVKISMWPTMNNSHPWSKLGKALRPDKPDWLMTRSPQPGESPLLSRNHANCLANTEFLDWLIKINLQGLAAGNYLSWAIDGSFFGDGGWFTSVVPVDCTSDLHDHLPGDSNYACQRSLSRLIAAVREARPDTYVFTCRPPMDLGVWSLRNVDVCFTLLESGTGDDEVSSLPGISGQPPNVSAGDQLRTWSRARVHRDFFPHYLDQPLLFPSRSDAQDRPSNWPRENLDYILLSAMSSSPNQLYYMPTKTGIPEEDKTAIRTWLDWGREHLEYLQVRKDLPAWPSAGHVDGSAHLLGDRGLVFLFNPNKDLLVGAFDLTPESIGLKGSGVFDIVQEYPKGDRREKREAGQSVRWEVPGESALVLRITPAR